MANRSEDASPFWSIIVAVFFGNFMAVLSTTTINVALPVFMAEFHAQLNTVQWMMSGFMLATGVIAPVIGFIGDKISYKRLYVLALAGFTAASALCMFAWNVQSLIAFRIVQGIFSGIIMPTTMTIIYQVIPKERQAFAISLWSVSAMLAPAFGPTLGGWLEEYYGWQALFMMNVPIGLLALAAAQRNIPYYRLSQGTRLDALGLVAVVAGTSSLLTAFSESADWGWASWRTIGLLAFGAAAIGYFVSRTLRVSEPLINLRLFKIPRFTYSLVLNCTITVSLYAGTFLIPVYMQEVRHASTLHTGLVMLPGTLAMAVFSSIAGKLYPRVGPFRLILTGIVLMAVSTWSLSLLGLATGTVFIAGWIAVRYIGIALSNMPVTNAGMTAVPKAFTGQASAVMNWIRQGTAALAVSLFSTVLSARTASHLAAAGGTDGGAAIAALSLGIRDVFIVGTILVVAALPLTFLLRKRKETVQDEALVRMLTKS